MDKLITFINLIRKLGPPLPLLSALPLFVQPEFYRHSPTISCMLPGRPLLLKHLDLGVPLRKTAVSI